AWSSPGATSRTPRTPPGTRAWPSTSNPSGRWCVSRSRTTSWTPTWPGRSPAAGRGCSRASSRCSRPAARSKPGPDLEILMPNAGDVLRQFYAAVQRRDMQAARALLADDMVFVGLFETYPNADAYIATFTQLMQMVTRLDVKTIIGEGD